MEFLHVESKLKTSDESYQKLYRQLPPSLWLYYWGGFSDILDFGGSSMQNFMYHHDLIPRVELNNRFAWANVLYYQLLMQIEECSQRLDLDWDDELLHNNSLAKEHSQWVLKDFQEKLNIFQNNVSNNLAQHSDNQNNPFLEKALLMSIARICQRMRSIADIALDRFWYEIHRHNDSCFYEIWQKANEPNEGLLVNDSIFLESLSLLISQAQDFGCDMNNFWQNFFRQTIFSEPFVTTRET
ncbi:MAG: hypothetical protein AAGB12_15290 [Pseudomonadota bacterium]